MANEKRLIDANRLTLEFIAQFCGNGTELSPDAQFEIQVMINHAPTVNAVEVCYCKDCRWRGSENCAMFYRCDCGAQHMWETDNDFCSYSENGRYPNENPETR